MLICGRVLCKIVGVTYVNLWACLMLICGRDLGVWPIKRGVFFIKETGLMQKKGEWLMQKGRG